MKLILKNIYINKIKKIFKYVLIIYLLKFKPVI